MSNFVVIGTKEMSFFVVRKEHGTNGLTDRPTERPTDGRTDGPTDGQTDGRTRLLIETHSRI